VKDEVLGYLVVAAVDINSHINGAVTRAKVQRVGNTIAPKNMATGRGDSGASRNQGLQSDQLHLPVGRNGGSELTVISTPALELTSVAVSAVRIYSISSDSERFSIIAKGFNEYGPRPESCHSFPSRKYHRN
jgi:hypothetical protein